MTHLLRNKSILFVLLLILTAAYLEGNLGARFFHGEMQKQIDETLKYQAHQIVQGYEIYDQNRGMLRSGIQSDALELNRIHGEFLLKVIEDLHHENLRGDLNRTELEKRISSVLRSSEENISLKGSLIWNAISHRNELDYLIKIQVQEPDQFIGYLGNSPSDLYHSGALDIVIRGGTERPWETYARAIYYEPLDLIVIFEGTSSYAEDNVGRLFTRIQSNLERNIMMIGTLEDVIVIQKSGYSLYSGRFEAGTDRRVTRILYNELDPTQGLGKDILNSNGVYKTLQIPALDPKLQERRCFILYDPHMDQTIIVSRTTAEMNRREGKLVAVSRFMGAVNVLVICLIAGMLITRDAILQSEEVNP